MADNPSKKNFFLVDGKLRFSSETEDEGGSGAGTITLSVEQLNGYLNAAFNKERRESWQRKIAACPFSEDPNNFLSKKKSGSCGFSESPQPHPLLSKTQQFSGIDDKLTSIPADSSEASEFPKKRLENQHRLQKNLGLGASKSVTLTR